MWGVIEAYMRLFRPAVHTLPRDILTLFLILNDFLDFRIIRWVQLIMAQQAGRHAGDAGNGTFRHSRMTEVTGTCSFDMHSVNKRDWLLRLGTYSKEVTNRLR